MDPAPQEQEEEVKKTVAPPTAGSTPLDFGGRIGRLEGRMVEGQRVRKSGGGRRLGCREREERG